MKLIVDNHLTKAVISGMDNSKYNLREELHNYLVADIPNSFHIQKHFQKQGKKFVMPKVHYFMNEQGYFATGFLPRVADFLNYLGVEGIEIEDVRRNLPIFKPEPFVRHTPEFELYEHQVELGQSVNNILQIGENSVWFPRGIWKAATNSGKTAVAGCVIQSTVNPRGLLLVDSQELFEQHIDYYESVFGTVGKIGKITTLTNKSGKYIYEPQKNGPLTIAMVGTLASRMEDNIAVETSLHNDYNIVIGDECFVAGTMVGNVPIETIQVGDYVHSYNHTNDVIELKKVLHKFVNPSKNLIKVALSNGTEIITTPNHPFYSCEDSKYKPVSELLGKFVHCTNYFNNASKILAPDALPNMWLSHTCVDKQRKRGAPKRYAHLFQFRLSSKKVRISTPEVLYKDEGEQPHASSRDKREDANKFDSNRPQTDSTWWKWVFNCLAAIISSKARVGNGAYCKDKVKIPFSYTLQDRCWKSGFKDSHRSRRFFPLPLSEAGPRCIERSILERVRVEGIEVYQQAGGNGIGTVHRQGNIYNIEVEDNNNYFANGVLVHNCHSLCSGPGLKVLLKVNAGMRILMSGTPLNTGDNLDKMKLIGLAGNTLCTISKRFLIDNGFSMEPIVKMYLNPTKDTRKLKYDDEYENLVSTSEQRASLIGNLIAEREHKKVLTTFYEKKHGFLMYDTFITEHPELSDKTTWVAGTDKDRPGKIRDFKENRITRLFTSTIMQQGINIADIEAIIFGQAGKDPTALSQFMGRGERLDGINRQFEWIDIFDEGKYVGAHSRRRLKFYRNELLTIEPQYPHGKAGTPKEA